jgi:ribosome hibernation promoting factor
MKIHLVPLRFQITEPIRNFACDKLSRLDEISGSISSAAVVLKQDHSAEPAKRFTAQVRLLVPGKSVHAAETASDLYSAIDGVENKLARQLRKRKTRMTDAVTRRLQRTRERVKLFGV